MNRRVLAGFKHRAFTLVEVMVVISILAAIAGIVIPNVMKFHNSGRTEAAGSELHNVQIAVFAAMANAGVKTVAGGALSGTQDLTFEGASVSHSVSEYVVGGIAALRGVYTVDINGTCSQTSYSP